MRTCALIVTMACAGLCAAGTIVTLELLDPAQWPGMPADRVVIDVSVEFDPEVYWRQTGILAGALSSTPFVYATDPNTGLPVLTAPDRAIGGRFVTCFSPPRAQNADARFRRSVFITALLGATPTAEPTSLDAAGFDPIGMDAAGYVMRIAIDLSGSPFGREDVYLSTTGARDPSDTRLASGNILVVSSAAGAGTDVDWYVFAVPEPATLHLLVLGALWIELGRRRTGRRSQRCKHSLRKSARLRATRTYLPALICLLVVRTTFAANDPVIVGPQVRADNSGTLAVNETSIASAEDPNQPGRVSIVAAWNLQGAVGPGVGISDDGGRSWTDATFNLDGFDPFTKDERRAGHLCVGGAVCVRGYARELLFPCIVRAFRYNGPARRG